ncbi:putative Methyltransferase, FkbM family [Mesorhizobium prunaredense]|uniref:Putative Methyltransferase, FkbM family n=1 Tax=Mesorhizobium prunaredense TaxID=1631249 RepID=A0A1R3VE33_9HYPH|nr:FkbM family methyltransferase [Mesorhizobium prunaredense]SIT58147.1 putative Methyltransferase, FkbM family [Mesorhizobium prunaredense]
MDLVRNVPRFRGLAWRLGRRLYMHARGEQKSGDMLSNGEAWLQRSVVGAVPVNVPLQVIDIGANHGEWTFNLTDGLPAERRRMGNWCVELFEPVPSTADILSKRIAASTDKGHLSLNRIAVSSGPGTARMAVMSSTGGTNTIHFDGREGAVPPGGWVDVPTRSLSDFAFEKGIGHIHLAKCDTEGHDANVLAGAKALLEKGAIDVIQFEYNQRWVFARSFLRDVFDLVDGLPYRVVRVDTRSVEVFDAWHSELERFFQSNYALVREPILAWLPCSRGSFGGSNTFEPGAGANAHEHTSNG